MQWIVTLGVIIVGFVLANIIHDIGHYVSARIIKANGIILEIGRGKKVFGKNQISLHANVFQTGRIMCRKFTFTDSWKRLVLYAGGIFGNMFGYLLFSILANFIPWSIQGVEVLSLLSLVNLVHMIYDIIPHQLGGRKTDGKRLYDMYKEVKVMMNR